MLGADARAPLWHLKQLDAPRPQAFANEIGNNRVAPSDRTVTASPPHPSADCRPASSLDLPVRPASMTMLMPKTDNSAPRQTVLNQLPFAKLRFI
jgi:hypothetical protein